MPQFGFYPSQIFWLLISFSILFVAMRYVLLPPIERIIKERQDKIDDMLKNAESMSEETKLLEAKYQRGIDRATQSSSKMLQQVHEEIALKQSKQEEELLDALRQNIQKVKNNLKSREHTILKNIETISKNFIQSVTHVFYDVDLTEKELSKKLKRKIKEFKDVN